MGVQDETMLLDSQEIPWLGPSLQKMIFKAKQQKDLRLFQVDYFEFLKVWKQALQNIGLPVNWAVPYGTPVPHGTGSRRCGPSWR